MSLFDLSFRWQWFKLHSETHTHISLAAPTQFLAGWWVISFFSPVLCRVPFSSNTNLLSKVSAGVKEPSQLCNLGLLNFKNVYLGRHSDTSLLLSLHAIFIELSRDDQPGQRGRYAPHTENKFNDCLGLGRSASSTFSCRSRQVRQTCWGEPDAVGNNFTFGWFFGGASKGYGMCPWVPGRLIRLNELCQKYEAGKQPKTAEHPIYFAKRHKPPSMERRLVSLLKSSATSRC